MLGYVAPSAFAITLASLGSAAARETTKIAWADMKWDDCGVQMAFQLGVAAAGTAGGDKGIYLWFYASYDGTNFSEPCTGADAAVTLGTHALKGGFYFPAYFGGTVYDCTVDSVRNVFGEMPPIWGIVVENQTGLALTATELTIKYIRPIFHTT